MVKNYGLIPPLNFAGFGFAPN